ncbi:MAG: RNA-binding protein [Candidatus Lokiarchaeota archaeon]|nr:RNA-binding protein [Candidatus Lokiarchaeota archaeon]
MSTPESGDLVIPGEKIGVIEMFIPGHGTFEKDGVIYSSVLGYLNINMKKRSVNVNKKGNFAIPEVGTIVNARVERIRRNSAMVSITNEEGLEYSAIQEGMVHISQTAKSYVENMSDAFNQDDIIKAKMTHTDRNPFQLSTVGKKLGVVLAFCRRCGAQLVRKGAKLRCPECGNKEHRKLSKYYGKMQP